MPIFLLSLSSVRQIRAFFMPKIMNQQYKKYTKQDHLVWDCLFERQAINLPGKVCEEYLTSLGMLKKGLFQSNIPDFDKLDKELSQLEGWTIEVVPGLIPVDEFFDLLARKKFCSSTWLRKMNELDYLEEPDMFHDIFGHIPLLAHKPYSDFIEKFGQIGKENAHDPQIVLQLQRLYWFTIEFGLIRQDNQLRIYGAGIISSFSESNAIFSTEAEIRPFNLQEIIDREFETDKIQDRYFVIESFEQLYLSLEEFKNKILEKSITLN